MADEKISAKCQTIHFLFTTKTTPTDFACQAGIKESPREGPLLTWFMV